MKSARDIHAHTLGVALTKSYSSTYRNPYSSGQKPLGREKDLRNAWGRIGSVNTPTRVYLPRRDVPQLGEREMVLSDVVEMPCSLFQRDVSLDSIHSFPLFL